MKSLYKFITEGVLSDINDTLSTGTTYVEVENWLNEHYNIDGTYDINVLKDDCVVNIEGSIRARQIRGGFDALTNGMFRFGTVTGDFDANYQHFKNLEGSPRIVNGFFTINHNMEEFTCKGAPESVGGIILGSNCISLEGMPEYCDSIIQCNESKLKSLNGCGKASVYHFQNNEHLEFVEGIPAGECDRLYLHNCKKLKSLKGLENVICKELTLTSCKGLKNLEGIPSKFINNYGNRPATIDLRDINLKTLKGIPSNVDWSNVDINITGCDKLEDISMLPKCAVLRAKFLPSLSKECYDNINNYAYEVETDHKFPMGKAKKSKIRGVLFIR